MEPATAAQFVLCRFDELADPDSRAMTVMFPDGPGEVFVVRQGERVYAYLNQCPHTGGPLDWVPDQFLNLEQDHIQCATHAALFRIRDGFCVAGPCSGDHLTSVPASVENGEIVIRPRPCGTAGHAG
ncbi:MAG: Rieske (2Fe-2S) protein [Halobacteria archaeon]|nr:Rieske (2Fe-2S) protein [Halobacteria archaeon]